MADCLPYTDDFLERFGKAIEDVAFAFALAAPRAASDLARALQGKHIMLVDTARTTFLIDQRVYASALERGHRAQALADRYLRPRLPAADTWKELGRGLLP